MSPKPWGVLVGIDGSEASMRAVEWAAADTAGTDRPLTICFVVDLPAEVDAPVSPEARQNADRRARRKVDEALVRLRDLGGTGSAAGRVVDGRAAAELLLMSADADQVVLGSRGAGGFEQLLLGSVGAQVAAHASCPVVVVRGEQQAGCPVVVGVDGSELGERAVEYAFGYAARHGLGVRAVLAYPYVATVPPGLPVWEPPGHEHRTVDQVLHSSVEAWSSKFPGVPVETTAVQGGAAAALTEASKDAALLVVGSRGHGGFAGLLLGSVSQAALRHSACPVAVVR